MMMMMMVILTISVFVVVVIKIDLQYFVEQEMNTRETVRFDEIYS